MNNQISKFLLSNGFSLIESVNYDEVNYKLIFSNYIYNIELYNEREILSVQLSNFTDRKNWIDINLIRYYILKDMEIDSLMQIDDIIVFLKDYQDEISAIFLEGAYSNTCKETLELRRKRILLKHPNIFKK